MKFINVDLVRSTQRKKRLRTQDITEQLEMTLDEWYRFLNWTHKLPKKKVKVLCEFMSIKESEIYENE